MKKRVISCLLMLMLLISMLSMFGCSSNAADEARSGVACVISDTPVGVGTGSAFMVGEKDGYQYYVTNQHVVVGVDGTTGIAYPALNVYLAKNSGALTVYHDNSGNVVDINLDPAQCVRCEVIYTGGNLDIAILKAMEALPDREALPLMTDTSGIEPGDRIYALGFPGSSGVTTLGVYNDISVLAKVDEVTVTAGYVSRMVDNASGFGNVDMIHHDAQVNHGNSGGPLINENGEVIGVNSNIAGMNASTGDSSSSYAINIKEVIKVLENEDIPYETGGMEWWWWLIIGGGVVLIAVIILIIVLATRKKKTPVAPHVLSDPPININQKQAFNDKTRGGFNPPPPPPPPVPDHLPRLQCLTGTFAGQRFSIDGRMCIGRDPSRCDLKFPENTQGISGLHCQLTLNGTEVWLQDLGSTYGTFLDGGRRLAANQPVQLKIGDRFWLASENQTFVIAPKGGI